MGFPYTKRAVNVFAGANAGGSARSIDPAEAAVWGMETEANIDAAAVGITRKATLPELTAIEGVRDGQAGEVTTGADKGSYSWKASTETWVKVGDLIDPAAVQADIDALDASKAAQADLDDEVTARSSVIAPNTEADRAGKEKSDDGFLYSWRGRNGVLYEPIGFMVGGWPVLFANGELQFGGLSFKESSTDGLRIVSADGFILASFDATGMNSGNIDFSTVIEYK